MVQTCMGEVPEQTVLTNCVENYTQAVWEEEVKVFGIRYVDFDAGYLSQDFYFLYEKRFLLKSLTITMQHKAPHCLS